MSTSPNNPERQCLSCGEPLPKDAPQGLCPKCLGQAALDSGPGSSASAAYSPTVQVRPTAPKIADIAAHFPQLEILELLGQGGMGVVYKARQPKLDRLVALKILPKDNADAAFAERFQREARALAKLSHPNIVAIHDVGEAGGFCYFLMEYVDGMNLRQLQRAKQLTPEEALAIVPKICEALQFAHDEGIVHRDIKPENILVDKKGRVKIADFGLAKLLGKDHADKSLTGTEQIMGTPHYMAPEQMEATHSVDHRADIYSLGVVFYEMLTGSLPRGRFEAPSKRVQVDVRLDEVVLKTLEYSPDRRYQHASEVKTDVEALTNFAHSRTDTPYAGGTTPNRTDLDAARDKVRAAASALFILGILNCVLLVAGLALLIATNVFQVPLNFGVGEFFPLTLWSLFSPVIVFGAWKMKRLESLEFARFAAVLAMVPMTSPLFLVGIGIGVWCLKTLGLPAVKEAFRGAPSQAPVTAAVAPEPPKPGEDFLLCNPRLPRMAQAITVFALIVFPALWLVDLMTMKPPEGNAYVVFVGMLFNLLAGWGGFVCALILFIGGLKLRRLDPRGPGWLRAGLWLHLAVVILGAMTLGWWEALLTVNEDSPEALPVGEAFLLVSVLLLLVFEIAALMWLRRNRHRLDGLCGQRPSLPGNSSKLPAIATVGAALLAILAWATGDSQRTDFEKAPKPSAAATENAPLQVAGNVLAPPITTAIRETPPSFGHVTHEGRFSDYAVEAPVNHRVNVWIEWWQNGRRITLPDFDLADSFTPAKGNRFTGYLDFAIASQPSLPKAPTVQWQWGLRGSDALTSRRGVAKDPFAGLSKRDSSYGHQPAMTLRSGEEVTLLVVRGDADQLEGQPWDPAMAGRADMEMHLKARIDAVPEDELGELSQSSKSVPARATPSSSAKESALSARIDAALTIRTDSTRNNTLAQLALEAAGQGLAKPAKRALEKISFVGLKDDTAAKCALSLAAGDLAAAIEVANLIAGSSLREATLAKLAQPKP